MPDDARRGLPSVGALLDSDGVRPLLERAPRSLVADAVRAAIGAARRDPEAVPADEREWTSAITQALAMRERRSLRPVINATGVVLHTNLGRAPLATAALDALREAAEGFCNLEYDLERGARGSRYGHCVALLRELTGAEDAIVVNNCAAGLVLALDTMASGRGAVVSRGELVEIGGSFRVPDIMAKSGARLVEVGTTNRTNLDDYRAALANGAAAVVKVHRSNFALEGFVADVPTSELAPLAREFGVPLIHDFGSGLLLSLEHVGLRGEPTAAGAVAAGATIVVMSGDKLLGGPQAGIIVGTTAAIAALRANPLARALRVDKLTLSALEATLALYRDPERALREIPALAMLAAPHAEVRARAERMRERIHDLCPDCDVIDSEATVGGGAFPTARLRSAALAIPGDASGVERRLRAGEPPVVARIADGRVVLDLRSVPAAHDDRLTTALRAALA